MSHFTMMPCSPGASLGLAGRFMAWPLADIHRKPPPAAKPLVLEDSVATLRIILPFPSTRKAVSLICSPIQSPSEVASRALGLPSGDLKSLTTLAVLVGGSAG